MTSDLNEGTKVRLTLTEWSKLLAMVVSTVATVIVSVAMIVGRLQTDLASLSTALSESRNAASRDRDELRDQIKYLRTRIDSGKSSAGHVQAD